MRTKTAIAFCPGHISGYFLPFISDNPDDCGSIGGGIVINEGVRVVARPARSKEIRVFHTDRSGQPVIISESSDIILSLLDYLKLDCQIETYSHLPIGCGYGMSAAALLATVHAVNALFNLGMNERDCAHAAHRIEVVYRSGLGDVSACQGGGVVIRLTPGPDGEIIRLSDTRMLFAVTMSPIKTSDILQSPARMRKISAAFPDVKPRSLDELILVSRKFADRSGLLSDEVRKVLSACDANGIPASMTMLGNGVFGLGTDAFHILKEFGEVFRLTPAQSGPRVLSGESAS